MLKRRLTKPQYIPPVVAHLAYITQPGIFSQLPLKLTESGHSGFKIPQEDGQFSFLMTPLFCEWFCLWSSRQYHVAADELSIFYLGQNAF